MSLHKWIHVAVTSTALLGLVACGGGGGGGGAAPTNSPTTAPANGAAQALSDLQGTWSTACVSDGSGGSQQIRFDFNGNQQTIVENSFSDAACSVSSKAMISYTATISVGNTVTTASGMTARKIDVTFNDDGEVLLTIFRIDASGPTLLVGDADSSKDADGRDRELDFDMPYSKASAPVATATPTPAPTQAPQNSPPVVIAGNDFTKTAGDTVTLDASAFDAEDDPNLPSIQWTQTSGVSVTLLDDMTLTPSFVAPQVESGAIELVFQVTATDNEGVSRSDDMTITVNAAPQAPPPQPTSPPNTNPCTMTVDPDADGDFPCARLVQLNFSDSDSVANGSDSNDFYQFNATVNQATQQATIILDIRATSGSGNVGCTLYGPGQESQVLFNACQGSVSIDGSRHWLRVGVSGLDDQFDYDISITQ